ncbi:hypothetical protein LCEOLIKB_02435 [Aeromonas hydrophila]
MAQQGVDGRKSTDTVRFKFINELVACAAFGIYTRSASGASIIYDNIYLRVLYKFGKLCLIVFMSYISNKHRDSRVCSRQHVIGIDSSDNRINLILVLIKSLDECQP